METTPQVIDLGRLDDAAFQQLYKDRIEPCVVANESDRTVQTFGRSGARKTNRQ